MSDEELRQIRLAKLGLFRKLLFSGISGMVGASVVYPLDFSKTRLQSQLPDPITRVLRYSNMFQVLRATFLADGVRGLYKGISSNLIGILPEKAIKITINDVIRRKMGCTDTSKGKILAEMFAGGAAGFCQIVITTPMEFVKIRMQNVQGRAKSISQIIREAGGFRQTYTGYSATMLRDVPFSMIYFALYARCKQEIFDRTGKLGVPQYLICGMISGTVAAWLSTPMDVVKTRLQSGMSQYSGIIDCATKQYAASGIRGMFAGAVPRVIIISPLFGIALMVYEFLCKIAVG